MTRLRIAVGLIVVGTAGFVASLLAFTLYPLLGSFFLVAFGLALMPE